MTPTEKIFKNLAVLMDKLDYDEMGELEDLSADDIFAIQEFHNALSLINERELYRHFAFCVGGGAK